MAFLLLAKHCAGSRSGSSYDGAARGRRSGIRTIEILQHRIAQEFWQLGEIAIAIVGGDGRRQ
jgi:hypothetical protein